ncbi:ABC transporter permease subunit [Rubritalea marina]|uniref:ABC transporter permease subunit n=1 Tax=Rubritalea marina TaxID=361055 RepID=UPI000379B1BF|nr:ABC transporter permease subunit [Rubritalea marina]
MECADLLLSELLVFLLVFRGWLGVDRFMQAYFIRRFLLMFPTLLGITVMVFTVTRFVPGGPMDRALQEMSAAAEGSSASQDNKGSGSLNEEQIEALEEQYNWDQPIPVAYLQWLGLMPQETLKVKREFASEPKQTLAAGESDPHQTTKLVLLGSGREVEVSRDGGVVRHAVYVDSGEPITDDGWVARIESPADRGERKARRAGREATEADAQGYRYRALVYREEFSGIVQGDLGRSDRYGDRVIDMVIERVPIALYFGVLSTLIIYGVCIPLGVAKAIGHRSFFDNVSSIVIFIGYSIPGFALGAVLLVYLGARMELFPLSGLTSPEFAELSFWGQVKDLAWHTVLPLLCYVISGFAMLTMMMKNNLMDNLSADYVRTAMAKGVSFQRAVLGHAFRNSFIPIATSLGSLITLFVGGSMLVEKVFDIQGFGMLQFQAIADKDYNVILGTLTISAFLMLLGNILSDIIVAMVDPRIKFT